MTFPNKDAGGIPADSGSAFAGWLNVFLRFGKKITASHDLSLRALLVISGAFGFVWGATLYSTWQCAVEGAQVMAGMVQYPLDNPFYMYQVKAWTLLHQIPAIALRLGFTEKFLSVFLSGIMGMLSFQALALSLYVFCRRVWGSLFAVYLIYITGAYSQGANYPIYLAGTFATYGAVGLSFLFVAVALLCAGKIRWGALMLGLSPAIHFGLGSIGVVMVLAACLIEWRHYESLRKYFFSFFILGLALSGISLAVQWFWIKDIPPVNPVLAKHHFASFIRLWDSHRMPVRLTQYGAVINALALFLSIIWLRFFRSDLTAGKNFLLRCYQAGSLMSLIFAALSWLPPEKVPCWFLSLMSPRFLNFTIIGFPGLILGLWMTARGKRMQQLFIVLALSLSSPNAIVGDL